MRPESEIIRDAIVALYRTRDAHEKAYQHLRAVIPQDALILASREGDPPDHNLFWTFQNRPDGLSCGVHNINDGEPKQIRVIKIVLPAPVQAREDGGT